MHSDEFPGRETMSCIPWVVRRSEGDDCNNAAFQSLSVLQLCIGTSQSASGAIVGCKTLFGSVVRQRWACMDRPWKGLGWSEQRLSTA